MGTSWLFQKFRAMTGLAATKVFYRTVATEAPVVGTNEVVPEFTLPPFEDVSDEDVFGLDAAAAARAARV